MALNDITRIPRRFARGSSAEIGGYTGPLGEVIVNTSTSRPHVQDGLTAGGKPLALLDDVITASGARTMLLAATTYYVRADGNDLNDGSANMASKAFATIQAAYNKILSTVDTRGFSVTIKVADGTYTTPVVINRNLVGGGSLTIEGNTVTPANAVISTTGASAVTATLGAVVFVKGFRLTTITSGDLLSAFSGGVLSFASMNFGACAGSQIMAFLGGEINAYSASYTISGGADSHYHAYSEGRININGTAVTLTGTPAFTNYFAGVAMATIALPGTTFSGAATGKRYYAHKNGIIDVNWNGHNYLPGSIAGTVDGGGRYYGDIESWIPFSPSVTAVSGAFADMTPYGMYKRDGDGLVKVQYNISIANAGTASGGLRVSLPFPCGPTSYAPLLGYSVVAGVPIFAGPGPGDTTALFLTASAGTPIISGALLRIGGQYSLV